MAHALTISQKHLKDICKLTQKKYRLREGKYIIEGLRLCEEALSADVRIEEFIVSKSALEAPAVQKIINRIQKAGIPILMASDADFADLADTVTPQGVAGIVNKKKSVMGNFGTPVLCLDGIKDPGNLGTILRSADWFGITTLFTSKTSVEVHNPKVVRGTMGALFRLTVHEDAEMRRLVPEFKSAGYRIIGTVSRGGVALQDFAGTSKDVLVIGGETSGLSVGDYPVDVQVTIPCRGHGDSLNAAVAASIMMYELVREMND